MTKTYKWKSRITSIIGVLGTITATQWANILPIGYETTAPFLVAVISTLAILLTEEKRVEVAETIITEEGMEDAI